MAYRSDRRGEKPVTSVTFEVLQAIGSPRVDFHYGQEQPSLHQTGRRYVCSLTPTPQCIRSLDIAVHSGEGLWKLTDLTGLWTRFEAAHVGNEPTRPLESLRLPTGPWTRFEVDPVSHASTAPTAPLFLSIGREPELRNS